MPGMTGAEPWELWVVGGTSGAECIRMCARPAENRLRKTTVLTLPTAQVFCLPLWLNETDSKQFASMIPLQLELRGLLPRVPGVAVFDWSVVKQESARTLVVIGVLPPALPEEIQAETYGAFDLSARYLPLPENTLTLWREQDQIVFAITRERHLVYFQALPESRLTSRVLQDLKCILATLAMQGVIPPLQQVMLWTEATPAELASLQDALKFPVRTAERPPPQLPSSPWKLVPLSVSQAEQSRDIRRWQMRGGGLALLAYLLFVGWSVYRFFSLNAQVDQLRHWQAEHAPALAVVQDTQAAWQDLRPVVDEKSYPLELLLHCSQSIPADQLHLTLFEATEGHLLIKGEAKNVGAAFQFLDGLKRDPFFSAYTWDMGQPHLLPNDLAQLQIEGTRGSGDF